jgi:hypothetical protein
VTAALEADSGNVAPLSVTLYLRHYGPKDSLLRVYGPRAELQPGERLDELSWRVPETSSFPIAEIGLEVDAPNGQPGNLYLDSLTWSGAPETTFTRPAEAGKAWHISWINGASQFSPWGDPFRIIQDQGEGLLIQGGDWENYRVETILTPHMALEAGLAARVQGLRRFYALKLVKGDKIRLIRRHYDQETVLGEAEFTWNFGQAVALALEVQGGTIKGYANGASIFSAEDTTYTTGGVALLVNEGRAAADAVTVRPLH